MRLQGAGEAFGNAALFWAGGSLPKCSAACPMHRRSQEGRPALPSSIFGCTHTLDRAGSSTKARTEPSPLAPRPAVAETYFLLLIFFSRRALAS